MEAGFKHLIPVKNYIHRFSISFKWFLVNSNDENIVWNINDGDENE